MWPFGFAFATSLYLLYLYSMYYLYTAFLLSPCSVTMAPVFFLITKGGNTTVESLTINTLTATLDYVCDI